MALASQMPPPLTTGLMSHARVPHVARGPCGSLAGARGTQAQAALKAEQDMKVSTVLAAARATLCLNHVFGALGPSPHPQHSFPQAGPSWSLLGILFFFFFFFFKLLLLFTLFFSLFPHTHLFFPSPPLFFLLQLLSTDKLIF